MKKNLLFFGLAFALLIVFAPKVNAQTLDPKELPNLHNHKYTYNLVLNTKTNNINSTQLYQFSSDEPFDINSYIDNGAIRINTNKKVYKSNFYLDNVTKEWGYYNSIEVDNASYVFDDSVSILHNDFNIYDKEGALLFLKYQPPMQEYMQEVSTNSLREHLSLLGTPLRVLLVVGLGIMGIFILVNLIPRIIHKFM